MRFCLSQVASTASGQSLAVEDDQVSPRLDEICPWNGYFLRWACHDAFLKALDAISAKSEVQYFAPLGGGVDSSFSSIGLHALPKVIILMYSTAAVFMVC